LLLTFVPAIVVGLACGWRMAVMTWRKGLAAGLADMRPDAEPLPATTLKFIMRSCVGNRSVADSAFETRRERTLVT